jgi:hypothetical protein
MRLKILKTMVIAAGDVAEAGDVVDVHDKDDAKFLIACGKAVETKDALFRAADKAAKKTT